MIQRRRVRKFESSVELTKPKDNSTYMSIFPLQKSTVYLQEDSPNQTNPIDFKDEELVDHFRSLIRQENVQKHQVDKYFTSVITRPAAAGQAPVSTNFLNNYNLEAEDMVQVCEKKMFNLKSYYNYLHDEEIEKAITKIQERNQQLQSQLLGQRQKQMATQKAQKSDLSKLGRSKQQQRVLDPAHIKFEEKIVSFNPKQKQRLEISKRGSHRFIGW